MSDFERLHPRDPLGRFVKRFGISSGIVLDERKKTALDEGTNSPAVLTSAIAEASSTKRLAQWWRDAFRIGEVNNAGSVPRMPDDWTPKMTSGRALSGNRRTHRMKYEVAGATLRMPSRSAIKSYMEKNALETLDVPVVISRGKNDIAAIVRVSSNPDGSYESVTLGANSETELITAEAVSATLERRNMAFKSVDDLYFKRHSRRLTYGYRLSPMKRKSFIEGSSYDEYTGTAVFRMKGRSYSYQITPKEYRRIVDAEVIGKEFNRICRNRPATHLTECQYCHRPFVEIDNHQCPKQWTSSRSEINFRQQAEAHREGLGRSGREEFIPFKVKQECPDLTAWMRPNQGKNTGWTRQAIIGALLDSTERESCPEAYSGKRNGEDGKLNFASLSGQKVERLKNAMPEKDQLLNRVFLNAGKRKGISIGGYVKPPSRGDKEGVFFNRLSFTDQKDFGQHMKKTQQSGDKRIFAKQVSYLLERAGFPPNTTFRNVKIDGSGKVDIEL